MQQALQRKQASASAAFRASRTAPLVPRAFRARTVHGPSRRAPVLVRATQDDEEEIIDPITGQPVSRTAAAAPVSGFNVKVGSYNWAYRRSEPEATLASPTKPQVVLLHGLGSCSYSYRTTMGLLGSEGYDAIAPDWIGHGDSDKPESGFDYSAESYIKAMDQFISAVGVKKPYALVVHGYVLGQYALLYAQQHPDDIDRLLILNTPVATNSKLRPELAAYKAPLPFMRPGSKPFAGDMYNASGSPYAMQYSDASVYNRPYESSPAASQVISKTMDKVDFGKLLKQVDEGFMAWRKPTALSFGSSDPFIDVGSVFEFLENKRTNMKAMSIGAKMGHMPQEDYAEVLHANVMLWLTGTPDDWTKAQTKSYKMSKKGMVRA